MPFKKLQLTLNFFIFTIIKNNNILDTYIYLVKTLKIN